MVDWTIIKILAWTESYFKTHAIDSPRLAAEILLSSALNIERLDLYLQHDRPLNKDELASFKRLIQRRVQREPVAYITGEKGFYDSVFKVGPDVLIPRPDTETLVEKGIELLQKLRVSDGKPVRVLELGVGSGAIIISLAKAVPGHHYYGGDISLSAVMVARENAEKILEAPVWFYAGAWLSCLNAAQQFDLIVSNPPYIESGQISLLEPEITQFEPKGALDGGADGLDCYREIAATARPFLAPGGCLLLEIGFDQKEGIQSVFMPANGYQVVEFIKDLAGHNRVVMVKKLID